MFGYYTKQIVEFSPSLATLYHAKQTKLDLDEDPVLKGRLIALIRIAQWVSPAVLEESHLYMEPLPDTVEGGNTIRDENGVATGVFVDNAKSLIPIPEPSSDTVRRYFTTAMKAAVAHDLTAIHDAGTSPELIEFFKSLVNYGPGGRLTVRSIKLVADGALGSWGAAMIEPYSDDSSTHGLLLSPPDVLAKNVAKFFEDGWQVNIHAIGDQANKNIIDIFEKELQTRNVSEVRPRIEHAQIMQLSDLDRMGKLGILASVQLTHATSDMAYAELRIGPEQNLQIMSFQSAPTFPSTLESIDPLKGFYAAVAGLTPERNSPHGPGGWYPSEKLTRAQALKGMTYDAAYAAFAEDNMAPDKPPQFVDVRDVASAIGLSLSAAPPKPNSKEHRRIALSGGVLDWTVDKGDGPDLGREGAVVNTTKAREILRLEKFIPWERMVVDAASSVLENEWKIQLPGQPSKY
ncbi:hypothetical protein M422DRAFT_273469 [Sphaerobolus stellatus SS14]|uniref:Amidohydrolase 3 domain-containing protein n=1 Tax=Sphaerobolus stellatus (strain SS14) TaxID=990650 RepID=A0A0C9UJI9_SPHS4|nr:hypothetical protein M422DRAFT_273469 [Sphaerobolus stellatus SS14]